MKHFIFLILMATSLNAQFKFNHESWNTKQGAIIKYDKVEHAVWMFTTTMLLEQKTDNGWKYAFLIGFANEVKDAVMDYRQYGWIGGNGFCWKDMTANIIGIILAHYTRVFLNHCLS